VGKILATILGLIGEVRLRMVANSRALSESIRVRPFDRVVSFTLYIVC
jgi:hypothetical protein